MGATKLDLARLRGKAEAARAEIVGEWTYLDIGEVVLNETDGDEDSDLAVIATLSDDLLDRDVIGELMAACSPQAILGVLDHAQALAAALTEARDLLLERTQGSPARSASHNARLVIEAAIAKAAGAPA